MGLKIGASRGNRTLIATLAMLHFTTKLYSHLSITILKFVKNQTFFNDDDGNDDNDQIRNQSQN